jgi:hypothetical protein
MPGISQSQPLRESATCGKVCVQTYDQFQRSFAYFFKLIEIEKPVRF